MVQRLGQAQQQQVLHHVLQIFHGGLRCSRACPAAPQRMVGMVVKLCPQVCVLLKAAAVENLVTCVCSTGEGGAVRLSRLTNWCR